MSSEADNQDEATTEASAEGPADQTPSATAPVADPSTDMAAPPVQLSEAGTATGTETGSPTPAPIVVEPATAQIPAEPATAETPVTGGPADVQPIGEPTTAPPLTGAPDAPGGYWTQPQGPMPPQANQPPYPAPPGNYAGGPYAAGPYAAGPYAGGPYAGGPYAGGPYATGPYAGGPYAGGPYAGGPNAGAPSAGAPYAYGTPPQPYVRPAKAKHIGVVAVAAVVGALVVSAASGAGVEYALNHDGTSPSALGIPAPSTGGQANNAPADINSAAIAAAVDPAIVDITTTLADGGAAAGTGMVLTSTGLVLTNNHVIENATTINAQIGGTGRTYTATVVGYDITNDVALLRLENASGLKTITPGNSTNASVGQPVVAIGNAGGKGGSPTVVSGTITAVDQTITAGDPGTLSETLHGLLETNAGIQPGDSGGPMVNASGQVIGMDTAASTDSGFGQSTTNQGYAIGINAALAIADQIKAGTASSSIQIGPRAFLGVAVSDSGSSASGGFGGIQGGSTVAGAYVSRVQSGSAAENAGIGAGDVIVSVDGSTISSASDLTLTLATHHPGNSVTIGWVDPAGASHSASVQLTAGPPA